MWISWTTLGLIYVGYDVYLRMHQFFLLGFPQYITILNGYYLRRSSDLQAMQNFTIGQVSYYFNNLNFQLNSIHTSLLNTINHRFAGINSLVYSVVQSSLGVIWQAINGLQGQIVNNRNIGFAERSRIEANIYNYVNNRFGQEIQRDLYQDQQLQYQLNLIRQLEPLLSVDFRTEIINIIHQDIQTTETTQPNIVNDLLSAILGNIIEQLLFYFTVELARPPEN